MILRLFRRRPQHCESCGDTFIEVTYRDGYRRGDGSPIIRRWSKCPRSGDRRPEYTGRGQMGACFPPFIFACANEKAAYAAHRPWRGACGHHSVSEDGNACWAKDGSPITGAAA